MKKNSNNSNENVTPKILVISALPITKSASTRAFYTYLLNVPKENIAQIYTNVSQPTDFDICDNYFQITDSQLLRNRFKRGSPVGIAINHQSCKQPKISKSTKKLISFGKKNYPIVDLMRNRLWKKKRYINKKLTEWVNDFNPDIIFFHNSNALFIEHMCLNLVDLTNKNLILEISDDYYFGKKFSLSPFYFIYRRKYKKIFKLLMDKSSEQIYVSNKMQEKYNNYFSKNGTTIFISSEISKANKHANKVSKIAYFGNIGLGREKSLIKLSMALKKVSNQVSVDVFCPQLGNSKTQNSTNALLNYKGFVQYDELSRIIHEYDLLLFIESFKKRIISEIEYSLSTKVGDYLSSGIPILAYGPTKSGSIEFLLNNKCAYVCTNKKTINEVCMKALNINDKRDIIIANALSTSNQYFNIQTNGKICLDLITKALKNK